MKDENKNQKVVFLANGDKKEIGAENLDDARMALRAVGLSLRLALEDKVTNNTVRYLFDMSDRLFNEGADFGVLKDGFCDGNSLGRIAIDLEYVYDKWFKRGSRKTKRYILDAMRHLLDFAKLAKVCFFNLEFIEAIYAKREKEFVQA